MTHSSSGQSPLILLPYPATPQLQTPLWAYLEPFGTVLGLSRGQTLYQAGDPADAVYFVLEGLLKPSRGNSFGEERLVGLVGPGDVVGLGGLSQQRLHSEDASALTRLKLVRLEVSSLANLIQKHPAIAQIVLAAMAQRAQDLLELLELSSLPVLIRISRALLWLGERFGRPENDGWHTLDLGLRHEDLASLVGVQRPTLTHTLSELRDVGLIRGTRGVYKVDLRGLERHLHRLSLAA